MSYKVTLYGPDGWVTFERETPDDARELAGKLMSEIEFGHELQIEAVRE